MGIFRTRNKEPKRTPVQGGFISSRNARCPALAAPYTGVLFVLCCCVLWFVITLKTRVAAFKFQ